MNNNDNIDEMVDRFLQWRLPEDFNPDGGITFNKYYNHEFMAERGMQPSKNIPVGTNLFTADQAREMLLHILNRPDQNESNQSTATKDCRPIMSLLQTIEGLAEDINNETLGNLAAKAYQDLGAYAYQMNDEIYQLKKIIYHDTSDIAEVDELRSKVKALSSENNALRARVNSLTNILLRMQISSCSCLTKSPDWRLHNDQCQYGDIGKILNESPQQSLYEHDKKIAIDFFQWWWNQGGSNTEQGFEEWYKLEDKQDA